MKYNSEQLKRQLFFLMAILLFVSATDAQPYRSIFGKNSTSWTSTNKGIEATSTDSVFTTSDTVFGGHNYKIIKKKNFLDTSYIREDTITGKAWFYYKIYSNGYPNGKDTESLIMDLSLSVGDSFGFTYKDYSFPVQPFFAKVDSVYFITARKYVRLKYNLMFGYGYGEEGKFTFIEGIGATAGILFQIYYRYGIPFLLCKFMDGQKEYSNLSFGGLCWVEYGGIDEKKSNQGLTIFPNPFNGVLNISLNEIIHEKLNIRIVNILGETVYSFSIENINDKNISLNNLNLNPGIYFIQINGDTFRTSKKVMCSK